ncbi:hypothetical protein [Sphingobacterium faecium]|uniref:hypothetical protein n=1 Tax=Sphingobacterium faecium TaxID=34087 RepID=UPI00320935C8
MKKKEYYQPTIEVVEVKLEYGIAAGSVETGSGNISIENENIEQSNEEWIIDLD